MKISSISNFDIDEFYQKKLEEGYATSNIRIMHNLLNKSFEQARKWNLIKINPVVEATPPSVKNKSIVTWNKNEINRFLNLSINIAELLPFYLAIYTGMRRGEVLALKWSDIDFEKKEINVVRSLALTKSEGLILKETKTRNSIRKISVSEQVIQKLREYKSIQDSHKSKNQEYYYDNGLIFCNERGLPRDPRNLLRTFYRLIKKADVPKISFHTLRHIHASLLLEEGVNPKAVSERLGHSNMATTLSIYSHVSSEAHEKIAGLLDEILKDN